MRGARTAIAAVVCALAAPALGQAPPARLACDGPSYRQFDFWIGRWDVFAPDGRKVGSSVIEPVASGCALLENWTPMGPGSGKSLNSFDRRDGQWHQSWIDASGGRLDLAGTGGDGTMTLAAKGQRITWTANADGSVRQLWESWDEAKNAWVTAFDGRYVRVP